MLFEKLDQLRDAPEDVKVHFVKMATLISVGIITIIWFFFFAVPQFLQFGHSLPGAVSTTTPAAVGATTTPLVPPAPPFSN
jgi:hypothetical protein